MHFKTLLMVWTNKTFTGRRHFSGKGVFLIPDLSKWNVRWPKRQRETVFSVYLVFPVNTIPLLSKPHSSMHHWHYYNLRSWVSLNNTFRK